MACPLCDECSSKSAFQVAQHMLTHTERDGPNRTFKFTCRWPECSKRVYGHNTNMLEHYYKHTGARPYACAQCSMRTNFKSSICKHFKRMHKGHSMAYVFCDGGAVVKGGGQEEEEYNEEETEEWVTAVLPTLPDESSCRWYDSHASALQTYQHEEVSTKDITFTQPLDVGVSPASCTSSSSTFPTAFVPSLAAGGMDSYRYGDGVVPATSPAVLYPFDWTHDPYFPVDAGDLESLSSVAQEDTHGCPSSSHAQLMSPFYTDTFAPTPLARPFVSVHFDPHLGSTLPDSLACVGFGHDSIFHEEFYPTDSGE